MRWYKLHLNASEIRKDTIAAVERAFLDAWIAGRKDSKVGLHRIEYRQPDAITYYFPPLEYNFSELRNLNLIPEETQCPFAASVS